MPEKSPAKRRSAPRRPLRRPAAQDRRRLLGGRVRSVLEDPLRQFQLSLVFLLLLILIGTAGYMSIQGLEWLDALYMTVITVGTVGFREVGELTDTGKAFTIALIVLGVGIGAWAIGNAVEVMLGRALWISVRRRRMRQSLQELCDHFVVCGYGRLGSRVVRDLRARGESFAVVDWLPAVEEGLVGDGVPHVIGDATADETLLAAGVERARGMVAALDTDAANVLAVLSARELNPALLIVARANSEASESKLLRAGANRVVTPESIGGHRLALALLRPAVHDLFERIFSFRADGADVGQLPVPRDSPFAGRTIAECCLRHMRGVDILAVRQPGGEFVLSPDPQRVVAPGDTLILIGEAETIYGLEAMYGE